MAKIDLSSIPGYADMTPEQKLAALEGFELPPADMTGFVRKDLLDKAASEAASYKKQLREKQTADEAAAAEQSAALKAMQEELDALRVEKRVADLSKRYMGMGYGEELAVATAKALADGDMDAVFKNQAAFQAEREKVLKAELLKQTPTPPAAAPDAAMQKDAFKKLSLAEKAKFAAENPETYASFYRKEN